ncbi:hypothetical protein [Polaromonas sp.]|uniref:hypothetical protein n=1 Tax=Polaromonas sp. TaxID=1869339 RepID=UPI001803CEFF|nr:hypothetical protein [Polaromonas sp.]NML85035.1 hypothetical protein [Polaromonas sp.]
MKDIKPECNHEISPSRYKAGERPDNGSRSSKGFGPSSGSHKDNPHKRLKLARHATPG